MAVNPYKALLHWYSIRRRTLNRELRGNPAPFKRTPKPAVQPLGFDERVVAYAHASLEDAGRMVYTEGPQRSQLFGRKPGRFRGAHADCSQYGASILHWLGNKSVTDTDYTGTLWTKGRVLHTPKAGCGAIWGAYPGQHFAFVTGKVGGVWQTVGFGGQDGPNRNSLTAMNAYFEQAGHPGVRFLDFA